MRILRPKNQISKPDNHTKKHQNGPKKIASIFDWPKPENFKNVQSFLNFVNFYKRFIKKNSKHEAPLNILKQKNIFFQ